MVNVNDLTIVSFETLMAFLPNKGAFRYLLDELQNVSIQNSQENTTLTGQGGRTIGQLKRNKAVTITGTSGMVSVGLIGSEVGYEPDSKEKAVIRVPDYLTVAGGEETPTATTTYAAVGTAGNEIKEVFVKDASGVVTKVLTQNATKSEGKFEYESASKKITFNEGDVKEGDQIVVYYDREVTADAYVENVSDKYSETLEIYLDAIARDKCQKLYHVQFYVPYYDLNGTFNLDMGDSQTLQNFEGISLPASCGTGSSLYWSMTVFGDEAAA